MSRVLLISLAVLIFSFSAGVASPFEALEINVLSGMETDRRAGKRAAIMMGELRPALSNSAWRPGFGMGTTLSGGPQLTLAPIWRTTLQYRFDVFEIIPFASMGLMGHLTDTRNNRTLCAIGFERVYQSGWLTFLELNASFPFSSNLKAGGVILLGLGYQYTLNPLY